jgi:hypothetical protein
MTGNCGVCATAHGMSANPEMLKPIPRIRIALPASVIVPCREVLNGHQRLEIRASASNYPNIDNCKAILRMQS